MSAPLPFRTVAAPAIATIFVAGTITAQGPVLGRLDDGRIVIRIGAEILIGRPVA